MEKKYTNLKKRIIPIILVKDYQVVKSRQFRDFRTFGNLEQTINVFNNRNVDEIIILDIDASKKQTKINLEILSILSKNNIMPLSFGGGINSIKDIELCLKHGCDKVVINSKSLQNINFIKEASSVFGKQCIVCSIDYMFDGQTSVPITIRLILGRGWGQGPQHAKTLHSMFSYLPGLKVIMPSSPSEAKGLLLSSIMSNDPVIFLENEVFYF